MNYEHKGISIIITCCDNYNYVNECIKSIKIKNVFYEIIVVDDSKHKYDKILKYKNLRVIKNKKNMGVQYSRNVGLNCSKYKYILMLDGDDKLDETFGQVYIEKSIQILEDNYNIAFTQCISKMFGDFVGYTITSYKLSEQLSVNKHHVPLFIIYRKNDGIKAGGYDTKIYKWQDWSFGVSLFSCRFTAGKKNDVYYFPIAAHKYRIYDSKNRISLRNESEFKMTKRTIVKNLALFQKYYDIDDINILTKKVLSNKPNRLQELIYVANNNIDIALEIINQRKGFLGTKMKTNYIP